MKKIILITALSLGAFVANAQKIKETEVPSKVKDALTKQYPGAKVEKWEKEDGNFEAELMINKVETSALYDATGKLIQTETEINISELPKSISDYVSKNLAGKKIKEASKITDSTGKISYEAEVDNIDYIFDSNGNLLKNEEEKDKDDDDKK